MNQYWMGNLAVVILASSVAAQSDLTQYDDLLDQLREGTREYRQVLGAAREQMAGENGDLSHSSSAAVLHGREKVELARSRLMALCAIRGIPFPDLRAIDMVPSSSSKGGDADQVVLDDGFAHAKYLVQQSFREESRRIARIVRLPLAVPSSSAEVVSCSSS